MIRLNLGGMAGQSTQIWGNHCGASFDRRTVLTLARSRIGQTTAGVAC